MHCRAEAEFNMKVTALKARHEQELAAATSLSSSSSQCQQQEVTEEMKALVLQENPSQAELPVPQPVPQSSATSSLSNKQEKARQKRAKQRQAELERQTQIDQETAKAGRSPRDVELELLNQQIGANYVIAEIPADGHCLYRAVAAQLNNPAQDYRTVRGICADCLLQHANAYAPFAELDQGCGTFTNYCERVRSGTEWGGHLEIRALATALQRSIHIYSVAAAVNGYTAVEPEDPVQRNSGHNELEPIRLSYHVHYYALGEHYNQVIPKAKCTT